jgi:hypothetical protein
VKFGVAKEERRDPTTQWLNAQNPRPWICHLSDFDDGIIAAVHIVAAGHRPTKQSLLYISPFPQSQSPQYIFSKTTTIKLLTIFLLIAISYLSMSFLTKFFRPFTTMSNGPATPMNLPPGAQTATVAAGCFWGVEHMYRKEYAGKGLYDARVGYIGGDIENPGYRAVCSGRTGRTYS